MHPKVKSLLVLAWRLAPIPGFLVAFGTWGFIFSRYSDPPIDMAGRALAASLAAASASAAAKAGAPGAAEDDVYKHPFTPYDACVQQQSLFPSQFGALECNEDDLASSFGWAWAPTPSKVDKEKGEKATAPRPRSSAPAKKAPGGDPGAEPAGGGEQAEP